MIPPTLITGALGVLKKYWPYLAIAAVVGAYTVGVYWAGGRPARAELEQQQAEWKAEKAELVARFERQSADSRALIAKLEGERDERIARINTTWDKIVGDQAAEAARADAELERLRREPGRGAAPQPVRVAAEVCDDAAGNLRLSNALSRYFAEVRRVIAGERSEVAGLLKACELQSGDLLDVQAWAEGERAIYQVGEPLH